MVLESYEPHGLPDELALRWPDDLPWQALSFTTALQPIKNLASLATLGHEALLRILDTTDGTWVPPQEFFHTISSTSYDMGWADRFFLALHIAHVDPRRSLERLFVNIEPPTFLDESQEPLPQELLRRWHWSPDRIVLEVTERRGTLTDLKRWTRARARLRDSGFQLALDDWDFTAHGVDLVKALKPDYVKVTLPALLAPSSAEPVQGSSVVPESSINSGSALKERLRLLEALEAVWIVEGIETSEQRDRLLQLNLTYGQGFWLGKPSVHL